MIDAKPFYTTIPAWILIAREENNSDHVDYTIFLDELTAVQFAADFERGFGATTKLIETSITVTQGHNLDGVDYPYPEVVNFAKYIKELQHWTSDDPANDEQTY